MAKNWLEPAYFHIDHMYKNWLKPQKKRRIIFVMYLIYDQFDNGSNFDKSEVWLSFLTLLFKYIIS